MKRIITIAALMIATSPLVFSQTAQSKPGQAAAAGQKGGSAEQELLKVGKEYEEAIVRGDAAAYDRIMADDYTFTSPTGEVSDKAREIERTKSGDVKFESGRADDVRTRIYGDTAVVTGLWISKGKYKGQDFSGKDRFTTVFVKRGGRWQLVAEHVTSVAAQPPGQ